MNEDELANAVIQHQKESEEKAFEQGDPDAEIHVYPEAHYNHYGNRGAVDLYVDTSGWNGHLYEFKSESAVRRATGANAIIRQFNRMRKFFFKGSDFGIPKSTVIFELCFTPSEYTARHVIENSELYASSVQNGVSHLRDQSGDPRVNVILCFRHPDTSYPLLMFTPAFDYREWVEEGIIHERFRDNNEPAYEAIKPALNDLSE